MATQAAQRCREAESMLRPEQRRSARRLYQHRCMLIRTPTAVACSLTSGGRSSMHSSPPSDPAPSAHVSVVSYYASSGSCASCSISAVLQQLTFGMDPASHIST